MPFTLLTVTFQCYRDATMTVPVLINCPFPPAIAEAEENSDRFIPNEGHFHPTRAPSPIFKLGNQNPFREGDGDFLFPIPVHVRQFNT
jgi:hypothetical protein